VTLSPEPNREETRKAMYLAHGDTNSFGKRGRMVDESYDCEASAAEAMRKQAEKKRRRGYV
jgi:predicted DNA-binding WGR domain protein